MWHPVYVPDFFDIPEFTVAVGPCSTPWISTGFMEWQLRDDGQELDDPSGPRSTGKDLLGQVFGSWCNFPPFDS